MADKDIMVKVNLYQKRENKVDRLVGWIEIPRCEMTVPEVLPSIASIDEAAEIIQTLMAYGMISPIEAVIYPEGTHKEMLRKANEWLWNYRQNLEQW